MMLPDFRCTWWYSFEHTSSMIPVAFLGVRFVKQWLRVVEVMLN